MERKTCIPCMPHKAPVWGGICMRACDIFFCEAGWDTPYLQSLPQCISPQKRILRGRLSGLKADVGWDTPLIICVTWTYKTKTKWIYIQWTHMRRNPSSASRWFIVCVTLCIFPIFILKMFYLKAHASNKRVSHRRGRRISQDPEMSTRFKLTEGLLGIYLVNSGCSDVFFTTVDVFIFFMLFLYSASVAVPCWVDI